jgi:hypothetical protein
MKLDKYIYGPFLFLISIPIISVIGPIAFVYTIIRSIVKLSSVEIQMLFGRLFYFMAYSVDQFGNVLGQYLFNDTLITKDSTYKFGNPDVTISAVLGMNKKNKTLSKMGTYIANILNWIDPNHVEKAADSEIINRKQRWK